MGAGGPRQPQPGGFVPASATLSEIEHHQALVKVRATSVNAAEWYEVTGPWFARLMGGGGVRRPKKPRLGSDLAGTVEAVGRDVTQLAPGDEVFGTSGAAWAEYGTSAMRRPMSPLSPSASSASSRGIRRGVRRLLKTMGHRVMTPPASAKPEAARPVTPVAVGPWAEGRRGVAWLLPSARPTAFLY